MIAISKALGWFVLGVGLSVTGAALGQGESKKNCGPGRRPGINGCVDAAPRARPKPEATKVSEPKRPSPEQGLRPPPDERTPAEAAERTLLVQELMRLEKLLKATPKSAPERAVILKRVADTYAELAKRAEHDREAARTRAERAQQQEKVDAKPRRRPGVPTLK